MYDAIIMALNIAASFLAFLSLIAVAALMFIGFMVLPIGFIVCKEMGSDLDKVLAFAWHEFTGKKDDKK